MVVVAVVLAAAAGVGVGIVVAAFDAIDGAVVTMVAAAACCLRVAWLLFDFCCLMVVCI